LLLVGALGGGVLGGLAGGGQVDARGAVGVEGLDLVVDAPVLQVEQVLLALLLLQFEPLRVDVDQFVLRAVLVHVPVHLVHHERLRRLGVLCGEGLVGGVLLRHVLEGVPIDDWLSGGVLAGLAVLVGLLRHI